MSTILHILAPQKGYLLLGALWLIFGLAACVPKYHMSPNGVDTGRGIKLFIQNQENRRALLTLWRVEGDLDLETKQINGRYRFQLIGAKTEHAHLTVFGPFHQVAFELSMTPERLRFLDPDKRRVVETSATALGLNHLTGMDVPPNLLFQFLLALTAPVQTNHLETLFSELRTEDGENIRIDPENGHLLERWGRMESKVPYQANYRWFDTSLNRSDENLPAKIHITWSDDQYVIVRVKKWLFLPATQTPNWERLAAGKGFEVIYPFATP
ncbi:MAG: hypothetical protein H7832_10765 [Magnetococcus sp. DMHC-6]